MWGGEGESTARLEKSISAIAGTSDSTGALRQWEIGRG